MMAQQNLTPFDWMTVYAYVDTLPQPIKQVDVVKYFATRPEGPVEGMSRRLTLMMNPKQCPTSQGGNKNVSYS